MIKLETHCHCLQGSGCASVPPETLIKEYKKAGYGGIVLTNHYCKVCYDEYPGETHIDKLDFYFSLFESVKKFGKIYGVKVFLGAETRAVREVGLYSEYMLYGYDKSDLYDNLPLFYKTQKEMFEFSEAHGIFMYQTHPFREGVTVGDPKFIHGAEAFNGHINHYNYNDLAENLCRENGLRSLSGTDYHDEGQAITGGIYIPESIENEKDLADYLFNNQPKLIKNEDLYKKFFRAKHIK